MATATIKKIKLVPPPTEVTLTLSLLEAQVLKAVVGRVSGGFDDTYRKESSQIYNALDKIGIDSDKQYNSFQGILKALPLKD